MGPTGRPLRWLGFADRYSPAPSAIARVAGESPWSRAELRKEASPAARDWSAAVCSFTERKSGFGEQIEPLPDQTIERHHHRGHHYHAGRQKRKIGRGGGLADLRPQSPGGEHLSVESDVLRDDARIPRASSGCDPTGYQIGKDGGQVQLPQPFR